MTYPFRHAFDATRYPPAYLRLGIREEHVQAATLAALRGRGALVFPVDSGAKLLRGRAVGALRRAGVGQPEAVLYGATGAGFHGLADLVGILPGGRALFVEVKAPAWLAPSRRTGRPVQPPARRRRRSSPSSPGRRGRARWSASCGLRATWTSSSPRRRPGREPRRLARPRRDRGRARCAHPRRKCDGGGERP